MDYLQRIEQCNHPAFGLVMAGSLVQSEVGTGNNFAASYLLMNCYYWETIYPESIPPY